MSWIVSIGTAFVLLFIYGMLVLIREHKRVKTSFWQKIKYSYMFPIFIMSYIPIAIVCFFKGNVQWKQIPHEDSKSIKEFLNGTHSVKFNRYTEKINQFLNLNNSVVYKHRSFFANEIENNYNNSYQLKKSLYKKKKIINNSKSFEFLCN